MASQAGDHSPLIAFLIWLADNPERVRDWGHDPETRGGMRGTFRDEFDGELSDADWAVIERGDFGVLRNIASDRVVFFLVLMTAVPKPKQK